MNQEQNTKLKVFKIEENKEYSREDFKEIFEEQKTRIEYKDYYDGEVKKEFVFLEPHKKILIKNYPYGYKRTNIKYHIDTTKRGGRFVSQTLNPKTQKWNNEKKSTYCAIKFLVANKEGKITSLSLNYNDDESKIKVFYDLFKDYMNEEQKKEISKIVGYAKTMKNVSFEIKVRRFKNTETGEISENFPLMQREKYIEVDEEGNPTNEEAEKQKQKETQDNINKSINYEIHKFKQEEGF